MSGDIPFIDVDNDLNFNLALVLFAINEFSLNKLNNLKLDFSKLQVLVYLLKNPSKINSFLECSGQKHAAIDDKQLHTVESLSINVDVLFNRDKLKTILKLLLSKGLVRVINDDKNGLSYFLTPDGKRVVSELSGGYFEIVTSHLSALKPLQSMAPTKLFSTINTVFKRV